VPLLTVRDGVAGSELTATLSALARTRPTTRINLVGLGLSKPSVDPAPRGCSQDGRLTDGSSGGKIVKIGLCATACGVTACADL
jgi:hypothetical protein